MISISEFIGCTASQNQFGYWCEEAYDGIINESHNGWSNNAPFTPAWAIFELEKATPITSLTILTGQQFNQAGWGHTLMVFKVLITFHFSKNMFSFSKWVLE